MKLLRRALTLPRDGRPWRVELSWGMTAAGIMAAVYALLTVVFSVIPFPFRLHGKLPHPLALDGAACVMMLGAMLAMLYFLPERGRLADKLGLAPINRRDLRIVLVARSAEIVVRNPVLVHCIQRFTQFRVFHDGLRIAAEGVDVADLIRGACRKQQTRHGQAQRCNETDGQDMAGKFLHQIPHFLLSKASCDAGCKKSVFV